MGLMDKIFGDKPPLIVVIDDTDEIATLLSMFLRSRGYRVERANNGEEGVKLVQKTVPALVLMDITMPKLDGMSALKLIKLDPKISHVPVLMCTDHSTLNDVEKCCDDGAAGYILKPFELTKVLEKVQAVLKDKPLPLS